MRHFTRPWLKLALIGALVGVPSLAYAGSRLAAASCCEAGCPCGHCDCPGCPK